MLVANKIYLNSFDTPSLLKLFNYTIKNIRENDSFIQGNNKTALNIKWSLHLKT